MNYDNTYHPKHSPFNKNGLGNQGYLYRIDLDLAQSFIFKIVELNPELKNIDYIQEILEIYS